MWGAIIGDLAGSIFEFEQTKAVKNICSDEIIPNNAFYSDDTILTVAIIDAILGDRNYEKSLRKYGNLYIDYKTDYKPYFKNSFSPNFIKWLKSNYNGTSSGNGAMMRISPIAYLFNDEETIRENVRLATIPSHNSCEAIFYSTLVALIIFYFRNKLSKEEVIKKLNLTLKYIPFKKFNTTCSETFGNCIYALFTSSSFEESIKKVISYGGDTDTNACIVGSMAEAIYGIDFELIEKARKKLPNSFIQILDEAYKKVKYEGEN